jgi:hypothetical protein
VIFEPPKSVSTVSNGLGRGRREREERPNSLLKAFRRLFQSLATMGMGERMMSAHTGAPLSEGVLIISTTDP